MGQLILDLISGGFNNRIFCNADKGVGKFRSKQFGCKKLLDLLTVNALNGLYCIILFLCSNLSSKSNNNFIPLYIS